MFTDTPFFISEENTSYETKQPGCVTRTSCSNCSQAEES
jgi:hypothetical protein